MACGHCNTFFCWLCSARLDPRDPYQHYRNPNSSCFNRVNQGIVLNLADVDVDDESDDDPEYIPGESDSDDDSLDEFEIEDL